MKRDCNTLKGHLFDLLIIGGGIHGAAAARHLAMRGYSVALVEKGDFCQATSFNSLKILHGGLRYLQHADFKRMRESIRARREFMQLAPHLVRPLSCLIPTKGYGIKGKIAMRIALLVNDIISFDRNKGLSRESSLPRGRIVNRKETNILIPDLHDSKVTGSALWYDTLLLNSERMLLLLLHHAAELGATMANYVKAEKITNTGAHHETRVHDRLLDKSFTIKSRFIINCAGPWLDDFNDSTFSNASPSSMAKAVNIIVDRSLFGKHAVGIEGSQEYTDKDAVIQRDKRFFFFVPWNGKTIIGTTYTQCKLADTNLFTEKNDIEEMVAEINTIYPAAKLETSDVVFSHLGLVPSFPLDEKATGATPRLLKHSEIIDHQKRDSFNNFFSVRGVKYTTALQIARDLEKLLKQKSFHPLHTQTKEKFPKKVDAKEIRRNTQHTFPHVLSRYGEQAQEIFQTIEEVPRSKKYLVVDPPLILAEILFFIREEMAVHLSDIVLRRTGLGTSCCPSMEILHDIAKAMAEELGWDDEQCEREIQQTMEIYKRMNIQLP